MRIFSMSDMKGGWFVGNFEPTSFNTDSFEVCFKEHNKGESWPSHYHAEATEINYLRRGKMRIQGTELKAGDIFVIEPNEVADPVFLEDCEVVVIKTPCVPGDKFKV